MSSQAPSFTRSVARKPRRRSAPVVVEPQGAEMVAAPAARRDAFTIVLWLLVIAIPSVIAVEAYAVASWLAQ